jgi:hypothetical protein
MEEKVTNILTRAQSATSLTEGERLAMHGELVQFLVEHGSQPQRCGFWFVFFVDG